LVSAIVRKSVIGIPCMSASVDSTNGDGPARPHLTIAYMARVPALSSLRRIAGALMFATLALAAGTTALAAPGRGVVLVVGDSISAGYGLPAGHGWTTLLESRLRERGYAYDVVNASISGDTTAGGRTRLPALLAAHRPAVVVIELGGNDGLRGGDLAATRANLDAMIDDAQKAHAKVLLVGMQLPPNYGSAYTARFAALYADAAKRHRTALVPFFFEGFATDDALFQADRVHPTQAAQPRLLDNVWPALEKLLAKPR
jgi:acyl-CoA thioesterase-1